ncbi:Hypothetical_protein [Hexamita inflata]|uniref:Hypothetical_protein n=1 Tax=Hexamita inflata TaxID=28002 RepID=A0AA86P0M3_9EUKA|nr:Hypothetical protein HINF_LOCUS16330 [Hexamita inflata]
MSNLSLGSTLCCLCCGLLCGFFPRPVLIFRWICCFSGSSCSTTFPFLLYRLFGAFFVSIIQLGMFFFSSMSESQHQLYNCTSIFRQNLQTQDARYFSSETSIILHNMHGQSPTVCSQKFKAITDEFED